jgi:hypothetical protein
MKWWSFAVGLPLGFYFVLQPGCKDLPASAGFVVPFGWMFFVEYVSRAIEWIWHKVR